MIHGPCGDWCTVGDENGYPNYRRRDSGITYEHPGNNLVDNKWVVPYSLKLLEMFNCHINVDVVSSISAVKYLYKHIYKGHDAATVIIRETDESNTINHDEIENLIETRYVGPVAACYRILSKPLQDKSHTITRLPIHLPNEQCVIIPENVEDVVVMNNLSRMYSVSPTQTELFYLRLILIHVKGAKSYNELRTLNNVLQPTFAATCLALGLIENDEEWIKAMEEATLLMIPQRLCLLFVRILIRCQPIHPEKLWNKYHIAMSEDFFRRNDREVNFQMAYAEINNLLNNEGRSLADFPTMEQFVTNTINCNSHVSPADTLEESERQYSQLNAEQKEIVGIVLKAS
ncbi:uncharacterized protein LOC106638811 [Copidosoma floridanum]|uniref:uncharacterized protein LOC106638811 n=1 Tax=Copidosoma floridanum TaxID=29053 RepID=UPI000C6F60D5|nr:uncharacterized protein LOC106638811 [Copidosoma floridanum]